MPCIATISPNRIPSRSYINMHVQLNDMVSDMPPYDTQVNITQYPVEIGLLDPI